MNENYIVINGKKIEPTEERLKQLWIEPEKKRKNPFERVTNYEYYCIKDIGEVYKYTDNKDSFDNQVYDNVNYFNDESFAKQVALHQLLYRKLLKFAYDNECEDTQAWGKKRAHYLIIYNYYAGEFSVDATGGYKGNNVHFSSEEGAERAVKEVIEPFMEEHPEFVW